MTVVNPGGGGGGGTTQGTLAARPVTPTANQLYFANDINTFFVGNAAGNAWQLTGYTQGTAAAKPANPGPNQVYFATDTGEWWVGNTAGNTWQSLGSSSHLVTGWFVNGVGFNGIGDGANSISRNGGTGHSLINNDLDIVSQGGVGIDITTAGAGLRIKEGSNCKQGAIAAMTAGSVTVANTSVTANSRIFVCRNAGGTNPGAWYVSAQTAGTSFVATSTNAADTGTGVFQIFEPG